MEYPARDKHKRDKDWRISKIGKDQRRIAGALRGSVDIDRVLGVNVNADIGEVDAVENSTNSMNSEQSRDVGFDMPHLEPVGTCGNLEKPDLVPVQTLSLRCMRGETGWVDAASAEVNLLTLVGLGTWREGPMVLSNITCR